jgi:hypothetical protein
MKGYLAVPANASGKLPGILVVHENRGLNPHIEDITRRLALDNFIAFAPDALTPLGGYPGDEDKAREAVRQARPGQDPRGLRGRRPGAAPRPECTGKHRRRGLLLRRRHGAHPVDAPARTWPPACRSTATIRRPARRPRSRRRC